VKNLPRKSTGTEITVSTCGVRVKVVSDYVLAGTHTNVTSRNVRHLLLDSGGIQSAGLLPSRQDADGVSRSECSRQRNHHQPRVVSARVRRATMILWIMVGAQLLAWGWFSYRGGKLSDKKFLIFTVGMLVGQLGAGIETWHTEAWRAFIVQVYFFAFTAFGGIQRWRQMRKPANA